MENGRVTVDLGKCGGAGDADISTGIETWRTSRKTEGERRGQRAPSRRSGGLGIPNRDLSRIGFPLLAIVRG